MDKDDIVRYITPFNLVLVAIFATILYAGYVAFQNRSTLSQINEAAPGHKVALAENETDLTVTLFYDYQCPHCARIDPIIREAAQKDGKVELLFKFVPFMGDMSKKLGRMAYAAGQQDKFLAVHDYLLQNGPKDYTEDEIRFMTEKLGLDHDRFLADLNSEEAKKRIENNMDLAMRLNVYATPTLYFAGEFFMPEGTMPNEAKLRRMFKDARQK